MRGWTIPSRQPQARPGESSSHAPPPPCRPQPWTIVDDGASAQHVLAAGGGVGALAGAPPPPSARHANGRPVRVADAAVFGAAVAIAAEDGAVCPGDQPGPAAARAMASPTEHDGGDGGSGADPVGLDARRRYGGSAPTCRSFPAPRRAGDAASARRTSGNGGCASNSRSPSRRVRAHASPGPPRPMDCSDSRRAGEGRRRRRRAATPSRPGPLPALRESAEAAGRGGVGAARPGARNA